MAYYKDWKFAATALIAVSSFTFAVAQGNSAQQLPPQSVFIDLRSFAVLGPQGPFRNSSSTPFFNPTNTEPPIFQIFHPDFLGIIGSSASFHQIASNATFAFAHEAPIYVPETDEVFFASNDGGPLGKSDLEHNNRVGKISMVDVETALKAVGAEGSNATVNVPVTELDLPDSIQMTNGGTGPYNSSLVLITSGRGPLPPSIALVNPKSPNNVTVLLDNFFGRQFNSLNDIKIHRPSGNFLFTDPTYGFVNHFRPDPLMPTQVYRLDPITRTVRVVATDFDECNGIALTEDGKIAYITDTGSSGGTEIATIYAFDVDPESQTLLNRRVFAYIDTGAPDGIQIDKNGNVYSGCGDGVQVWNSQGTLLGKFFIGSVSANFIFAGNGRLVILAETKIFLATIAVEESRLEFP